ncbi:MAG: DsbA family protein, partial [Deltaproteobacteria bacterium]
RSLPFLTSLQQTFVKVRPRTLDPAEPEARRLLGVVGATTVPVYIFGEDIEQYPLFAQLSQTVEKKGSYYVVHPMFAGACAFLDRPYVSGRLDVFFDLTYPRLAELARRLKELRERDRDIDVRLHFLAAVEPAGGFVARGGDETVEEFRRLACIDASDPQKVFDYLACRTDAAAPGEAQACARAAGLDVDRLSRCATGREGEDALRANIALTDELNIGFGPTLVVGNRDVYAVAEVPSLEELESIVKADEK